MSVPVVGQLLQATGGQTAKGIGAPVLKSANYQVLTTDFCIVFSASNKTATLPLASTCAPGQMFAFVNGHGVVNGAITASGSDSVAGVSTITIPNGDGALLLICDGVANFYAINSFNGF